MKFPYGVTATRLRGTAVTDPYSGEETGISWDDPDELEIAGCAFNPGGSQEPVEVGRSSEIARPTLYVPFEADVLAGDRIRIGDTTYEIDGRPAVWSSPFTDWDAGIAVTLKDVEG